MIRPDNPAGRLYLILRETLEQGSRGQPMRKVWARVFDVSSDEPLEFFAHYSELLALIKNCRLTVESTPALDRELYLRPVAAIETLLAQGSFDQDWAVFAQALEARPLGELEFLADALSRLRRSGMLEEEKLAEIRGETEQLGERVGQSELSEPLKQLLLGGLNLLKGGITHYKFRGTEGLEEALEQILGSFARNQHVWREQHNHLVDEFWRVTGKVEHGISVARAMPGLPPIYESVKQLLSVNQHPHA